MTPTIERIEAAGPAGRARRVAFSDGSSRLLPRSVATRLTLEEGDEMDPETLEDRIAGVEPESARERGLQILGARERSSTQFTTQLRSEGFSPPVIDALRARFVELGLIDDERFAAAYARTRAHAGRGRRQIIQELEKAGVDPEAASLHAEQGDDADEITRAMAFLNRRPADIANRDKSLRRLVSRGFDLSVSLAAIDAVSRQQTDHEA